jgi:maltose O-acetyltransferase
MWSLKKMLTTAYDRLKNKGYVDLSYRKHIELLISKGLKIGRNVWIEENVSFDAGYPYLISVGNNCSISARVRLLAHDDSTYKYTGGYARIGKIEIKDNCFIGQDTTILPGVTIGPNVMIAAGSLVNKNIAPNSCVAGVPARFYAKLDDLIEKHKKDIQERPIFMYSDLRVGDIEPRLVAKVTKAVEDGICYVEGKEGKNIKQMSWNS